MYEDIINKLKELNWDNLQPDPTTVKSLSNKLIDSTSLQGWAYMISYNVTQYDKDSHDEEQ